MASTRCALPSSVVLPVRSRPQIRFLGTGLGLAFLICLRTISISYWCLRIVSFIWKAADMLRKITAAVVAVLSLAGCLGEGENGFKDSRPEFMQEVKPALVTS